MMAARQQMSSDVDAVKQLRPLYCRFIDTKQWERLLSLFAEDARFEGFTFIRAGATPTRFVGDLSAKLADAATVHHCHSPEIIVAEGDKARATWPMSDIVEWPQNGRLSDHPTATGFKGFGFYEEEYRLIEGIWRISFLRLTRTRIEPTEAGVRIADFDPFAPMKGYAPPSTSWVPDAQRRHIS